MFDGCPREVVGVLGHVTTSVPSIVFLLTFMYKDTLTLEMEEPPVLWCIVTVLNP